MLVFPLFALGFFLGAYLFFYRGSYEPPPAVAIPFEAITPPASVHTDFTEVPLLRQGTLLVDGTHRNDFDKGEISVLLSRVADRGYDIQFIGESAFFGGFRSLDSAQRFSLMEEGLRKSGSLAVILPEDPYSPQEADLVERFVQKGGRLLLIADPTRGHQTNTLAERFGINFPPDYLYNTAEYDLNFQNIFIRDFLPDEVTRGLGQVSLYVAGSIKSSGPGLAFAGGNTRSSIVERVEPLYVMVKARDGRVLALSDLTFMVPPRNSILDNDRLISNIADHLTSGAREFDLGDFPHFFRDDVDILLGRSSLFDVAASLRVTLADFQIGSQVRAVEDITRDTVYLGLYEDAAGVAQYLETAGIQVDGALRTPFTSAIDRARTAIVLVDAKTERSLLVILGESRASLVDMVSQLGSGSFQDGLVSDSIGVYRTP